MNARCRVFALAVATAGCLAATAACSSSSNNSVTSAASSAASAAKTHLTAAASAMATPTAVQHGATLGAYCSPEGASGVNSSGLALTCTKQSSGQVRWVSAVPHTATVKAGNFCATNGQTATSGQQTKLVCKPGSDGRLRWTNEQSG